MTEPDLQIHETEGTPEEKAIFEGLKAFNQKFAGDAQAKPLTLSLKSEDGTVIGGIVGKTAWGWLFINYFWLDESLRGQGVGTRLIEKAEAIARERGCKHAYLDTLSFQARPFYEKFGYRVYGELEGFPPGYRRFYMKKDL